MSSPTRPILVRADTLTAIALLPFLSFFSRRPFVSIADAIEFALVVLLEFRMMLSVLNYLPLTAFETSPAGVLSAVGVLVVLNVVTLFMPTLRGRF